MLAKHPSTGLPNRAGSVSQIARQKLAKRSFANEADSGGVFLGRVGQADPTGNLPNDGLWQVTHRKKRPGKLSLIEPM